MLESLTVYFDADLKPFAPRRSPSFLGGLRNYLENCPLSAYRDGVTVLPGLWPLVPKSFLLTDPELVEEVLVTRAENFARDEFTVRTLSIPLDQGSLFFAEGSDWKWQRRAVAPAFRYENLQSLVPTFAQCAMAQAEEWRAAPPGEPVKIMKATSRITFAVIEKAVLGETSTLDRKTFLSALSPTLRSMAWRRLFALVGLPDWTPHPGYFRTRSAEAYVYRETKKMIDARRASGSERRDILGLMLSATDPETGRAMTETELIGNLYTFMVVGHETAAISLGWSLWLLAKDQASQDRVREEALRVAGAEIDADAVEKLVFTRQVIEEAMRLFPPGALIGRQPREDTTLGPHSISKREPIYVGVWCLHRHEKLWDEPNAFDPDRFAPEKVSARHRCAYLPFGAGPRICVGMSFGMLEMITILATLIRGFRFRPAPGPKLELIPSFTVRPKGGLPLFVEPI